MAEFNVNPHRSDPYQSFKFRVAWDGRYVAGISKVSALRRSTEVVEHRAGGDPSTVRKTPGKTRFDAITLERGVTHDLEFEAWANQVYDPASVFSGSIALANFRKDVRLEFFNEDGQLALAYNLYRCWVSEYEALPELDASSSTVAIQSIKLEVERWERDEDVGEPPERSR